MQNYAKFSRNGKAPNLLSINDLWRREKPKEINWSIRALWLVGLLPVPLTEDGRALARWERGGFEELLRIESAFEQPEAVGVGVELPAGFLAVEIEDLGAFLRWLQRRGLLLPKTTTIEQPRGWTLLYQVEGARVRGVQRFQWGRLLGEGALVVVPDTAGYEYLIELHWLTTAPKELIEKATSSCGANDGA